MSKQLPDDPRDYYIFGPDSLTLEGVSQAYSEAFPGGSGFHPRTLKNRSAAEDWTALRAAHRATLVQLGDQKTLEKKAQTIVDAIEALDKKALKRTQALIEKTEKLADKDLSPVDMKRVAETLDLLHKAERFHSGIEPNRVYGSLTLETDEGDEQDTQGQDPFVAALSASAAADWSDQPDADEQNQTREAPPAKGKAEKRPA